jgi:hypothetical protein
LGFKNELNIEPLELAKYSSLTFEELQEEKIHKNQYLTCKIESETPFKG